MTPDEDDFLSPFLLLTISSGAYCFYFLLSKNHLLMQMIAPRNIYDLADTVEAEQLAQEGANLEQVKELLNDF